MTPPSPAAGPPAGPAASLVRDEPSPPAPVGGEGARTWVIELPPGIPVVTANNRMNRYERNRRVQGLKDAVTILARAQHIPVLYRIDFLCEYLSPPRLKRDRAWGASDAITDSDGIAPTGKACLDGLAAAEVVAVDSAKYVRRSTCVLAEERHLRGLVRLHITEVSR